VVFAGSTWFVLVLAVSVAGGCLKEEPPEVINDFDDTVPFEPDPETWARGKVRRDVEKPALAGPLMVGTSVGYVDGPVGTSMAGFGGRGGGRNTHWSFFIRGTAGFYGWQSVKVVALTVGRERLAFVKSPLMSSESYLTDAIDRHLRERHGLDLRGRVITVAGHSHHATARYWPLPELLGAVGLDSFDAEVAESSAAVFADAIAEAFANQVPGEWAHASQENWDPDDEVYRDRRGNNDPMYGKDPRLTMMAFRRKADAVPLAVVFNFPVHGTAFGSDNDFFTEDASGYVEHKFEEAFFAKHGTPVKGLFAQSAGGDASPSGDSLGHPTLARLERLGEAAAPKLLALYDTLSWSSETELAVRSQRIELRHERVYAGRPWAAEFRAMDGQDFEWGAWQCFGEENQPTMEGRPKYCTDLDAFLELLSVSVPHDAAHQVYLTVARLGDLWMLTIPGEPNYSIVKYAREKAAAKTWNGKPVNLMVLGYSQDHLLYLSSPDDWYLSGYETEMSLWGPGGGVFLADEQLAVIDAMIAGRNGPALFQESPALSPTPQWTPRARERSIAPGTVVEQPAARLARTETARFAANCGDPGLGSPHVKVQRRQDGTFVDVAARHGWPGRPYDNARYEMVSAYEPNPLPADNKSVPERTHTWRFYWQVPSDWPAGTYRLELACRVIPVGEASPAPRALTIDSDPFEVTGFADGTALTTTIDGTALGFSLRVPGVPEQTTGAANTPRGKWAVAGYRLLDAGVRHEAAARVRAPLKFELLDAQGSVVASGDATFDATKEAHTATSPSAGGATRVRLWLASDATPAKVEFGLDR